MSWPSRKRSTNASAPSSTATPNHLFLSAYTVDLDTATSELEASEIAVFITDRALITVRKDTGLRRIVLPMREVTNSLMHRDLHVVSEPMAPYYQDIYDHILRVTE